MWFIIHFYMMRYLNPDPFFHIIAFLLYIIKYIFRQDTPSIGFISILCMYAGFALYPSLIEFSFLPYYIISFYGLRNRDYYVFLGSIIVGIHLINLNFIQILAHILMNVGRSIVCKPNALDFALAHFFLFVYQPCHNINYIEYIAGVSAFLCHLFNDNMDLFSASMMFNSMDIIKVLPLHVMEMDWFLYFKNNHFKRVYNTYNFIIPLGVLLWVVINKIYM